MSSPIPGLKAKNINNKSTFIWLLHYTASRVYPVSTFPYLILKMRTKNNDENNIDNSKEKWQLAVERGVKTEGLKNSCVCVCVFGYVVSPSELSGSLLAPVERCVTCNMSVSGPSCGGCCVLLGGSEEQRWVLVVRGRQADRGGSLLCKVSLLTAGTASFGKAGKFISDHGRVATENALSLSLSLLYNTLLTSLCSQTRAQSARRRRPRRFLGGPFLPVRLLLGPAQVAFHLHKLGGVLLLLLIFLLLQLELL